MGLQNQLYDLSTDSIPLLLIHLLANSVTYLRSIILTFFKFSSSNESFQIRDDAAVRSGLSEQLDTNRVLSYRFVDERTGPGPDCVVCLNGLRDGEIVRKLDCRHVFHKDCLDGWIRHFNFNCPLCRSPLKQRRVDD